MEHTVKSIGDGTNQLMWRHVAITFNGGEEYSLYLNANAWPISSKSKSSIERVNPNYINVGFYQTSGMFKGSMACISFFETALTQQQLRTWMLTCP